MMIECRDCIKTSQSIAPLPALSEHCLPLLEALCSAYEISTHHGLFDTVMLAFKPRPAPFICLRSKVMLGQMELDEDETRLLLRTLLGRNLRRLVELIKLLESSDIPDIATCGIMVCESSVQSTISRLIVLMQVIEGG
ncbi:hypothetical protein N7495_004848 [Penicillium taxi]|uniref:uncharacterized protein n=1 Tax=Penicillium taxi TaxID=168475 RepID=UPI002544FD7D|nr:uncharacterized protein N7495_004848 [Penicillium taxi]KAJ5900104.1 hypothetical protein N7495_004848 [Penicillium taxi]